MMILQIRIVYKLIAVKIASPYRWNHSSRNRRLLPYQNQIIKQNLSNMTRCSKIIFIYLFIFE